MAGGAGSGSEGPTQERYPSIGLVRRELDRQVHEQGARGVSFDTKAGLLLAFGAALIGSAPDDPNLVRIISLLFAASALVAAVAAMFPRVGASIGPAELRNKYLMEPPEETELALLDTRIFLYEKDEGRLNSKVFRMKVTVVLLVISVFFLLGATLVGSAQKVGTNDPPSPGTTGTSRPTATQSRS